MSKGTYCEELNLVQKLRYFDDCGFFHIDLFPQAADEIERLQQRLEELQHFRSHSRCKDCGSCDIVVDAGLCPHGMPLAENVCGPCSEGRPNAVGSGT